MYVRLLFVLLAALNLGAAGWLLFAGTPRRTLPPATDPGVPELQLVEEPPASAPVAPSARAAVPAMPAPIPVVAPRTPALTGSTGVAVAVAAARSQQAPVAAGTTPGAPATSASRASVGEAVTAPGASGAPAPAVAHGACTSIGPFATDAAAHAALQALSPHVARIRARTLAASRPHGFWVYLPAAATHERALAETRALAAKGIKDSYVINSGDAQNAISLGVYNDPVNAQNRVDQIEKLGFAAKVRRRADSEPVQWLDVAVASGTALEWRQWVADSAGLTAKPIACF